MAAAGTIPMTPGIKPRYRPGTPSAKSKVESERNEWCGNRVACRRVLHVSKGCKEARTNPADKPPLRRCKAADLNGLERCEAGLLDRGEVGFGGVCGSAEGFAPGVPLTPTAGAKALGPRALFRRGRRILWKGGKEVDDRG